MNSIQEQQEEYTESKEQIQYQTSQKHESLQDFQNEKQTFLDTSDQNDQKKIASLIQIDQQNQTNSQEKQKKKLQLNVNAKSYNQYEQKQADLNLENSQNQNNNNSSDDKQKSQDQQSSTSSFQIEYNLQVNTKNLNKSKTFNQVSYQQPQIHSAVLTKDPKSRVPFQQINPLQLQSSSQLQQQLESSGDSNQLNSPTTIKPVNKINEPLIEHLDIDQFKINACGLNSHHNHKNCINFHNMKDRRRPGHHYSSDMCEFVDKGDNCPKGDSCNKCHNRVEQLYHFEKYKKRFCSYYPYNIANCDYGIFCSFAHNEDEIQIDLIHNYDHDDDFYMFHFKTIWCPFNLTQHDKSFCVYAHNWQDYRRKPQEYNYQPILCPNWNVNDYVLNYETGCLQQYKCNKSHGWKENEFHPLTYKTRACLGGKNCQNGKDCPFFHGPHDKRLISAYVQSGQFKYVPRKRVTYKMYDSQVTQTTQPVGKQPVKANVNKQPILTAPQTPIEYSMSSNIMRLTQMVNSQQNQKQLAQHQQQIDNFNQQNKMFLQSEANLPSYHFENELNEKIQKQFSTTSAGLPPPGFRAKLSISEQFTNDKYVTPQVFPQQNINQIEQKAQSMAALENLTNLISQSLQISYSNSSNLNNQDKQQQQQDSI